MYDLHIMIAMLSFVLCRDDFNQSELKPYFAKAHLSLDHF